MRREPTLKGFHGGEEALAGLPEVARGGLRQVSFALDEIRLLHSADIERSVLITTLVSRAVLVPLTPVLGAWTPMRVPFDGAGMPATVAWAAASVVALGTAVRAPVIVERVMQDSDGGRRLRNLLLRLEVPIALAALPLLPSWTVVVFASGWTNWWQRQTLGLVFDWRKLGAFVAAVVGLQSAGLTAQHVRSGSAAGQVVAGCAAIGISEAATGRCCRCPSPPDSRSSSGTGAGRWRSRAGRGATSCAVRQSCGGPPRPSRRRHPTCPRLARPRRPPASLPHSSIGWPTVLAVAACSPHRFCQSCWWRR